MKMDDCIPSDVPDDDRALGPLLGTLPPEILDVVVKKLGWFQTTFAMAGRTCREAVERVSSPRAVVLTEEELERMNISGVQDLDGPLMTAAADGDLQALAWVTERFERKGMDWRAKYGKTITNMAAKCGHLERLIFIFDLQRMYGNGCEWDEYTCELAALGGHLKVLRFARENRCPWDEWTCARAAEGGHLEVLQWAHQNGCPWVEHTCACAAKGGHLEVLQWAREHECPWDEDTCNEAAREGHLELLQWARQNGCPWESDTCAEAAEGGHLEVLRWLRENWCPWNESTSIVAAREGHLEVLRWARQNGCPWSELIWDYADPRCRAYLIEHGCPGAV